MERLRSFTACLLIAWMAWTPCALAQQSAGGGVQFVLPDPAVHWSLLDSGGSVLCVLPCTYRVPAASQYRLRLDVAKTSDQAVLTLPPDLQTTTGKIIEVRPVHGISRASKLAMESVGFVVGGIVALLEIVVGLDHFSKSPLAPCLGDVKLPTGGCQDATVAEGVDWASGVGTVSALFLALGVVGAVLPDTHLDIHASDAR